MTGAKSFDVNVVVVVTERIGSHLAKFQPGEEQEILSSKEKTRLHWSRTYCHWLDWGLGSLSINE